MQPYAVSSLSLVLKLLPHVIFACIFSRDTNRLTEICRRKAGSFLQPFHAPFPRRLCYWQRETCLGTLLWRSQGRLARVISWCGWLYETKGGEVVLVDGI
jgi:hypothetical protein